MGNFAGPIQRNQQFTQPQSDALLGILQALLGNPSSGGGMGGTPAPQARDPLGTIDWGPGGEAAFNPAGLTGWTPFMGTAEPWRPGGQTDLAVLLQYAQAGHPTAIATIQDIQGRIAEGWDKRFQLSDPTNPMGNGVSWLQHWLGGGKLDPTALQGISGFGIQPQATGGPLRPPNIQRPSTNPFDIRTTGTPNFPRAMNPIASFTGMPNPTTRVLGGPNGQNPWMPDAY